MPTPKINNKAPIFKGECTGNKNVSLSDLRGKNVVLYFQKHERNKKSNSNKHIYKKCESGCKQQVFISSCKYFIYYSILYYYYSFFFHK